MNAHKIEAMLSPPHIIPRSSKPHGITADAAEYLSEYPPYNTTDTLRIVASAYHQSSSNFFIVQPLPPRPDVPIRVIIILNFVGAVVYDGDSTSPDNIIVRLPVVYEHPRIRCLINY